MKKGRSKTRIDLQTPLLDKNNIQQNENYKPIKTYLSRKPVKPKLLLCNQLNNGNILNESRLSSSSSVYYLNDIVIIIAIMILSSIQFPIFISISDSSSTLLSTNQFIQDFAVLSWKWEIFSVILLIYGSICHMINKSSSVIVPQFPSHSNASFTSYLNYFIQTSNLQNITSYITKESLTSGLLSVISLYCLFYSCRKLSFGICALINNLASLIPYYLMINSKDKFVFLIKIISPLFIVIGLVVLLAESFSIIKFTYLIICFSAVFGCQYINQITLSIKIKEEQPFRVLLSTYINYFIVSFVILITILVGTLSFDVYLLFGWLLNLQMLIKTIFGFGLFGVSYVFLSVLSSMALRNKSQIRLVKYIEIPLNDIIGIIAFGLSKASFSFIYAIGIIETLCGIVLLEFCPEIIKIINTKVNQ